MATSFPSSIDSFVNPSASDALDSVSVPHADQHANINDAMVAVQTKLGTGTGTIGTWTTYTPTFTGLTVGNATLGFSYTQINKVVHVVGVMYIGSTTTISSTPIMSLPVNRYSGDLEVLGTGYLGDLGTGTYMMFPLSSTVNGVILFGANHTVGSFVIEGGISATAPFTWTTNDRISVNLTYRAA
jgi:hypothetical protein